MQTLPSQINEQLETETSNMALQWEKIASAIRLDRSNQMAVFRFIFFQYKGPTFYRYQAGIEFLKLDPEEGVFLLKELITSVDSDDRDTAVMVIGKMGDPVLYPLCLPVLADKYPYLQFSAIEVLGNSFPDEVKNTLKTLLDSKENWVREKARQYLDGFLPPSHPKVMFR